MDVKAWRDIMAVCFSSLILVHCYLNKTSSVIKTLLIKKKHYMHKVLVYRWYEWVWLSQLEQTGVRHISSMSTKNWCSKSLGSIFHIFSLKMLNHSSNVVIDTEWMFCWMFLSVHTLLHNRIYFPSVWILLCVCSMEEFAERTLFSTRAFTVPLKNRLKPHS